MGCMGCLVLPVWLAIGFAGALGGGIFYFTRAPVQIVEAQLADLREGKIDAAYGRLSNGYRAQLSRDAFADMVEKHVALRDNKSASFWNRSRVNDQMALGGTLTARSGATETVTFELVREQGEWKIAAIRFGDTPRGEKL